MSVPTVKLERDGVIIERSKVDYENNLERFKMRGFKLVENNLKENIKEVDKTFENEAKVIPLKKKRKTRKKK
jgi:hypothetical protein